MMKRKNKFDDGNKHKKKVPKKKESYKNKHPRIVQDFKARYEKLDPKKIKTFDDIPLSDATRDGLKALGVEEPTEIQKESIGKYIFVNYQAVQRFLHCLMLILKWMAFSQFSKCIRVQKVRSPIDTSSSV